MRLLHLADVHLDTLFAGRGESLGRRLKEAVRGAFERAVDAAIAEKVDALLIAGDLFDGERLSFRTEVFLQQELARLAEEGIAVHYATGNHDPGEGGAETGRVRWPGHVAVYDGPEPRSVEVARGSRVVGRVTGAGHATTRETRDLSRAFPAPPDDRVPAVALLHTQVGGARGEDAHDPYAPSELRRLRESGYDYWALGHVHQRQELSALPAIHYPGNVQGRSPRETGPKGGLLVEIPGRGAEPRVEFVELAPVRWELLRVDGIERVGHATGLVQRIVDAWEEERAVDAGRQGTEWVVRVELVGASPLHRELAREEELETLRGEVASALGALEVDVRAGGVRPAVDPAPYLSRQDAAGEALRFVRDLSGGRLDPLRELELEAGDLAGAPPDADREGLAAYVRELLAGGDRALLERFQREAGS